MTQFYRRFSNQTSLSDSDVLDIRRIFNQGDVSQTILAESYDVDRRTIHNIVTQQSWTHVPQPQPVSGNPQYMVYPDGRVWSTASERFLTPSTNASGEQIVTLSSNGSRSRTNVAQLVAQSFLSTRKRNFSVSYRDNPSDPHFTNLEIS